MCGIVGYIGRGRNSYFLVTTLKRLEYRGYDSCGLATFQEKNIFLKKIKGKIDELKSSLKRDLVFPLGIAHTRWATHGVPSPVNAHPHFDCQKNIFLVHNGIIENHIELKDYLIKRGHRFVSQTDTEVIPHLIEEFHKKEPFLEAFLKAVRKLKGSFAISVIKVGEKTLFFAKKDSPLILGVLSDGFILASDIPAIASLTSKIVNLNDGWAGIVKDNGFEILTFQGKKVRPKIEKSQILPREITKKNYTHFMLKEIFEQPKVISRILSFYINKKRIDFKDLNIPDKLLRKINKIFIFACGTAFHAGFVAKYFLEKYCHIDVEIAVSSEARYRDLSLSKNNLVLVVSQSGETADTLAATREAKRKGAKVIGICNVLGSSLTKESDGLIYTLAGPEIGVASTKAYTAQIFSLYLLSLYLAGLRNSLRKKDIGNFLEEMRKIPVYQDVVLGRAGQIQRIAGKFSKFGCFLFLGRGINYPSALEGALKLKEISYIPAEGYPAGEMKHGPIALIDEYRAVVCIALKDKLYSKMISNIQEIRARKGKVLGIINYEDKETIALMDNAIYIPKLRLNDLSPLVVAIPLQLFAYFVAKNLGCEIDQPRNLAKSVTVE